MLWTRFKIGNDIQCGILEGDTIHECDNDPDSPPIPEPIKNGNSYSLSEVELLTPTKPTKVIALWNNYKALADEKGLTYPDTPLYLFKPENTWLASGKDIKHPPAYDGKVFFEGEVGIVIGKTASNIDSANAKGYIAGYTCINDVTAFDLLKDYEGFDQWSRAKGFDTFGVMGPAIATDVDWKSIVITTRVNGEIVQEYPASDMITGPEEVVSELSKNMTLNPGDVICCGTSVGLGPMPIDCDVEVELSGVGRLKNRYVR